MSGNRKKAWEAAITSDGKRYSIGTFETAEEAAEAYDKAAIELHKEFARLNSPDKD